MPTRKGAYLVLGPGRLGGEVCDPQGMRVTNSLAALKAQGPEVRINIRMMPPGEIEKSVLDGRLHVGVIPDIKHLSGLDYIDLYDEESQLYCGHRHSLFAPSRIIS